MREQLTRINKAVRKSALPLAGAFAVGMVTLSCDANSTPQSADFSNPTKPAASEISKQDEFKWKSFQNENFTGLIPTNWVSREKGFYVNDIIDENTGNNQAGSKIRIEKISGDNTNMDALKEEVVSSWKRKVMNHMSASDAHPKVVDMRRRNAEKALNSLNMIESKMSVGGEDAARLEWTEPKFGPGYGATHVIVLVPYNDRVYAFEFSTPYFMDKDQRNRSIADFDAAVGSVSFH
jgi:hypothetical protein